MDDTQEMDCKIYVETDLPPQKLGKRLAALLSGTVSDSPASSTVHTPLAELDIRKNSDADSLLARGFPDGFLFFSQVVEIYPAPKADRELRVALVAGILRHFWSQGFPAVAACDYEDNLPHRGGYNDPSLPWVSSEQLLPR
jgi:hypothetical protein